MRKYDCKIKIKCRGICTATYNIKANLEIDETKSLEQIEKDIINDIKRQYNIGMVIDYTISFKRVK